ncbi:MAG: hypothetical protein JOZ42_05850 [Acetobacteraceae bacterium]|nr:hypothetical protein [Acetobacteraceae bacterium]
MRLLSAPKRLKLAYLPVAIGALMLFVPWFFFAWNITVAQVLPKLQFRTNKTLAGVIRDAGPQFGFANLTNYKYQTYVSRLIGEMSPVYKPAIRWKNQLYYSAFGMSGMPGIIVGAGNQLYQPEYLKEFCARRVEDYGAKAEAWAAKIRTMQDFFQTRGKLFLYVITPSKPAVYPSVVPPGYPCPSTEQARREKLPMWTATLDRAGVHYVDTASLVAQARDAYPISMFPRGGVHWNRLAASLGAQAVTAAANRLRGGQLLTPFTITWERAFTPEQSDRDILDILNLMYPDKRYEVPVVALHSDPPPECRPARITEVAGSFLFLLDDALMSVACPPVISNWFYWDLKHFRFPGGTTNPLPVDAAERSRALLTDLDLMIYEENEAVTPEPPHGLRLLEFIAAQNPRS